MFVTSRRPKFGREEMSLPGVVGEWSLKDLLSHLSDWERRFISWYQAGQQGKVPEVPPADSGWEELDTVDDDTMAAWCTNSIEDVLTEFRDSFQDILATVTAIPEHDLFTPGQYGWTGKATLADYVALTTFSHYDWAKQHIRR